MGAPILKAKKSKGLDPQFELKTAKSVVYLYELFNENSTLEELLTRALQIVLNLPWLPINQRGAIFIANEQTKTLHLSAEVSLAKDLLTICKEVPYGKCLCGRAALERKVIHASCVDERHENGFEGMTAHGHYNVPLMSSKDNLVGVVVLYLDHGHEKNEDEIKGLEACAKAISFLIHRFKEAQQSKDSQSKDLLNTIAATYNHEINNPLMIATGHAHKAQKNHPEDKNMPKVMDSLKRITQVVKTIRKLSHDQENLNIKEYIGDNKILDLTKDISTSNQILEALDSNFIITKADTKGNITYVNEHMCKMSGYSKEELIGQNHSLLKSGHHPEKFFTNMWTTINEGKTWKGII